MANSKIMNKSYQQNQNQGTININNADQITINSK